MDVVPVELENWSVDPFAGEVRDGYIYGRGAIDVKDTLMVRLFSLIFHKFCIIFILGYHGIT